jgi:hypothetical protein
MRVGDGKQGGGNPLSDQRLAPVEEEVVEGARFELQAMSESARRQLIPHQLMKFGSACGYTLGTAISPI